MFSMFFKRNPVSTKNTLDKEISAPSPSQQDNNLAKPPTPSVSTRTPFKQEAVSRQRVLLQENLEKFSVPNDEQRTIMAMRDKLPDNYHEMPLKAPSQCFWLFENVGLREKTWFNQHHIDAFDRCQFEIREAAKDEREESSPGMKFG